ncbi:GNAT family N-acetyltransferase [Actinoplanes sp. Pm04-4]|uniref:GNAT family N-acetyltransferase n=1 Tax=Paractinoplanes pyxinae TaxID=2997416 RepID=A0ABT4B773_9ACTN|nr:GNAT family N-acetyltransferase [Actinoplanes pyxinae]MCY1142356.1 GNAT family N-acetyltransferase [Actinoplanes pyxinae]
MTMRSRLTTNRLFLSPFTLDDVDELHAILADPRTNTIGSGPFTAIAQTEKWIRNRMAAERDHGLRWYAVRQKATDVLIGNCGLFRGRADAEIGYLIHRPWQGRGFASEAVAAVLDECRSAGIGPVWAIIRPHNTFSIRIAERAGLRLARIESDERGPLHYFVTSRANT